MAKAVLVMDMPSVCGCCKMYKGNYQTGGDCICLITGDKVELNTKPDSCPLRKLPERETEMTDAVRQITAHMRMSGKNLIRKFTGNA